MYQMIVQNIEFTTTTPRFEHVSWLCESLYQLIDYLCPTLSYMSEVI